MNRENEIAMNVTHLRPLIDLTLWIHRETEVKKGIGLLNSNLQITKVYSIERDELS